MQYFEFKEKNTTCLMHQLMENQERLIEVGKHENYFETENRTISLVQRIMVALNTLIFCMNVMRWEKK